ncbi:hypothetical protein [Bartonella sp. B1098]|uniref:hypothetical protein n=1 Tax=Bartonella sp. B1098 TaxID=2911421 RepID=UPI0020C2BFCD|nr:hypothetical protein [Bartonella sp. B1098]
MMKIFKNCILCIVEVAIFFSQVLGENAHFVNGGFQNAGFISAMKQEKMELLKLLMQL